MWNKTDLESAPDQLPELPGIASVRISARTGAGLETLLDLFARQVWHHAPDRQTADCEVSARHAELLRDAGSALARCREEIRSESWELAASCLREALAALGSITGETVSPDILDEIFSRFCIGK